MLYFIIQIRHHGIYKLANYQNGDNLLNLFSCKEYKHLHFDTEMQSKHQGCMTHNLVYQSRLLGIKNVEETIATNET